MAQAYSRYRNPTEPAAAAGLSASSHTSNMTGRVQGTLFVYSPADRCHKMKYLHTMVRARDLDETLDFYCNKLGLVEIRRQDSESGRFTLVFLAAPGDLEAARDDASPCVEITWNWDPENYDGGRNFGHLAYRVDDIYATCQRLMDAGVTINRPPRDGHMAFVRSPDGISIELLQSGESLPRKEPWASMENTGAW